MVARKWLVRALLFTFLSAVLASSLTGCRSMGGSASDGSYSGSSGGGCCGGH